MKCESNMEPDKGWSVGVFCLWTCLTRSLVKKSDLNGTLNAAILCFAHYELFHKILYSYLMWD
jgi:hypothetical protein